MVTNDKHSFHILAPDASDTRATVAGRRCDCVEYRALPTDDKGFSFFVLDALEDPFAMADGSRCVC